MISRPTTQQLIDAIAIELNSKVAPAISDPTVQVQLEMAIAVLKTTAVRSANELAWMQEERDAIETDIMLTNVCLFVLILITTTSAQGLILAVIGGGVAGQGHAAGGLRAREPARGATDGRLS